MEHDNTVRLHGAIGYVTPTDKLAGREEDIWAERKMKLAEARLRCWAAGPGAGPQRRRARELPEGPWLGVDWRDLGGG